VADFRWRGDWLASCATCFRMASADFIANTWDCQVSAEARVPKGLERVLVEQARRWHQEEHVTLASSNQMTIREEAKKFYLALDFLL